MNLDLGTGYGRKQLKFAWYSPKMTRDYAESFAEYLRKQSAAIRMVGAEQEPRYDMRPSEKGAQASIRTVLGDWGVIGIFVDGATTETESGNLLQILALTWWAEVQNAEGGQRGEQPDEVLPRT